MDNIIYRNEQGSVRKKTTGCSTAQRAKAEDKLADFVDDLRLERKDPFAKHRRTPLETHILHYFEWQTAKGFTDKQVSQVRRRIRVLVAATKVKRLDELTVGKIDVALKKLRLVSHKKLKEGETPRETPLASARTRNLHRAAIRGLVNWMLTERRLPLNPVLGMEDEDESLDVRHPRTSLTDEQFLLLYQTAKGSSKIIEGIDGVTRARAYFLSVVTGLRRRELASLTRSAFTLDGSDPRLVVEAAFSKHRRRDEVRLPTYIMVELRLWLTSLKADEPLVPKLANRKTHKMIRLDLEAAGLPYRDEKGCFLDWHALRHTCITRAWRSGASAAVVQQIARHADIRETMGYSHTTGGEIRQAVDAVPPLRLDSEGEAGVA